MQTRLQMVQDEKHRQEYENKQRTENLTKQHNDLKSDLDSLQESYNEK